MELQAPLDSRDSLDLLGGRGREGLMVEMDLEGVKVQKERKAARGVQDLKETP